MQPDAFNGQAIASDHTYSCIRALPNFLNDVQLCNAARCRANVLVRSTGGSLGRPPERRLQPCSRPEHQLPAVGTEVARVLARPLRP